MSDAGGQSPRPTVIKIGGSTLGAEDTTLEDVATLQREGKPVVVVHGGGALITEWLDRLNVETSFVDGLRVTTAESLDVVIGVLRGVVNVHLVAELQRLGARAVGLSGIDSSMVQGRRADPRLGFVGEVTSVHPEPMLALLEAGIVPVIAPIGIEPPAQPLNINADTVAGEVARAIGAHRLIFLTDVDGLLDADGALIPELDGEHAKALRAEGTLTGGMIPKVDACLRAAEVGSTAYIANGRLPETLRRLTSGAELGTRVTAAASTGG